MMANTIPWDQPRGFVHDITELATLSGSRCHILCVSERTLYLLANFAALDVGFIKRFSVRRTDHGYEPVGYDDPIYYPLFREIVNAFQLEVQEMDCDIESGLQAIADALEGLSINVSCGGGGGGDGGGSAPLNCISDLPNDTLIPPSSTQPDPDLEAPPDGFATWDEYFDYKCKAAEFIWDLERKHMLMLKNFELISLTAAIVGPIAAGLLGVLPAAMTPAGFVVFVTSIVAIGVVAGASWFYMAQMVDWWDDNHDDIVCSLYGSGTSAEAVSGLSNALEDAIQAIVAWGALEGVAGVISELLGQAFGALAGNGIVEPLFKAVVAATQFSADCSTCGEVGEWHYAQDYVSLEYDTDQVSISASNPPGVEGAPDGWGCVFDYTFVGENGYSAVDLVVDFGDLVELGAEGVLQVRTRAPLSRDHNIFRDYIHGEQQWWATSVDGESWGAFVPEVWDAGTEPAYTWGTEVELGEISFRYLKLRWLPAWFAEAISQDGAIDAIRVGPIIE